MCAPTPPGTLLNSALPRSLVQKAPWWAPSVAKPMAFSMICDFNNTANKSRPRTQIEWKGNKDRKVLVVSQLPTGEYLNKKHNKVIFFKKTAKSAIIRADAIELFTGDKPGSSTILDAPWNLD